MLRHAAYVFFIAVFAVFAYVGIRGWTQGPSASNDVPGPEDERALRTGFLTGVALSHFGSMGYPWVALREDFLAAKRELPPDPAPMSVEDAEKANRTRLGGIKVTLQPGRIAFPQLFKEIREQIEQGGVKVTTGSPPVSDTYMVDLPAKKFTGMTILGDLMAMTNKDVVFVITGDGVNIGTDEACNRAARDAALVGLRRRVAAENADPRLDADFRPDVEGANIVAFVRGIEAQTGVEVAVDQGIWEMGPALAWRAPPRPLRVALDELCRGYHWYWRWFKGRVWLLKA